MLAKLISALKKSSYWKDIAWVVSGNALVQAISILILPILTRLYKPEDFAIQTLFIQTMGFVVVIMTLRYEYLIQLPKKESDAEGLVKLVIVLSILWSIILYPILWFYRHDIASLLGDDALAPWLLLLPISSALMSISIAYQHITQRNRNYRKSSFAELINKGGAVSTSLAGYWLFSGPAGLVLAQATGTIAKILYLSQPKKKTQDKGRNLSQIKSLAKEYTRLSGALVYSHLMSATATIVPTAYIAHQYGSQTLGQFALVASTIFFPSALIGNAIGQVYYQRAAESWGQGKSFSNLWATTAKKLALFGIPIYAMLFFISPIIYPLFFGDEWEQAGEFARIISISAFFSFATSPLDRACLVVNAWWYAPIWHTVRATTTVIATWVASHYSLDINSFLQILVVQMSALYLIDYWSEWRFANFQP